MGRYYYDKKDVAEDYLKLSVVDLKRLGFLITYRTGGITWTSSFGTKNSITVKSVPSVKQPHIRLIYNNTNSAGERQSFDYEVRLTTTPCNYGGERYWLICPLSRNNVPCGRHVGVLYKVGGYFGCRHCYDLSYQSRNENKTYRGYPFSVITNDIKLEALYKRMKRKYYAGKPTKLYAKILHLERRQGDVTSAYLLAGM